MNGMNHSYIDGKVQVCFLDKNHKRLTCAQLGSAHSSSPCAHPQTYTRTHTFAYLFKLLHALCLSSAPLSPCPGGNPCEKFSIAFRGHKRQRRLKGVQQRQMPGMRFSHCSMRLNKHKPLHTHTHPYTCILWVAHTRSDTQTLIRSLASTGLQNKHCGVYFVCTHCVYVM